MSETISEHVVKAREIDESVRYVSGATTVIVRHDSGALWYYVRQMYAFEKDWEAKFPVSLEEAKDIISAKAVAFWDLS